MTFVTRKQRGRWLLAAFLFLAGFIWLYLAIMMLFYYRLLYFDGNEHLVLSLL